MRNDIIESMRYEKIKNLEDKEIRRLTGVKPETFKKMVEILSINYAEKRKRGGHKSKLLVEDMLLIALEYWRENRTYFHIAKGYEIHETTAIRIVRWEEDTLISDGTFSLPGKKAFLDNNLKFEIIAIDATETTNSASKKGQKLWYSGKKKQHTIKSQVVADKFTKKIICTSFANGKCHDFNLLKKSKLPISSHTQIFIDLKSLSILVTKVL